MENNVSQFSSEQKEKIKTIIENGPYRDLPKEDQERRKAYWKQKWYSSLKTDAYFIKLYETQKKITRIEKEWIRFKEKKELQRVERLSPLTREDILRMPNEELAKYLNTFKTKESWQEPSIKGLAGMINGTVQKEPEKFIENLTPFLSVGYLYVYNIFWGIKEAYIKKKTIDWGKLFEFVKQYIDRDDFWKDTFKIEEDDERATHLRITKIVGELIQEGTKDDSWAFSEKYFKIAQEIIFLILDKQQVEKKEDIKYYTTDTFNSSFGTVITALSYLTFRIAQIDDKKDFKKEIKWSPEIKDRYECVLQRGIVEGFTLFGWYLSKFYYLDEEWTKNKIKEISLSKDKVSWEAFIQGYLLYNSIVDENLYKLTKEHCLIAIDHDFKDEFTTTFLVQYICIRYLNGYESIEDTGGCESIEDTESLFKKILDKWSYSQIGEIIKVFVTYRNYDVKDKIIAFWQWVYENKYNDVQKELNSEDKKILSFLSKLTVFLPKIDSKNFNWLRLSASCVDIDFNSSFFIECLNDLKDKEDSVKYIGEIFLKILEGSTPDYEEENIRTIVEFLYQKGYKEDANNVCNVYGRRGYDFLRDLYEKYNSSLK
jgi:hypothetical protein